MQHPKSKSGSHLVKAEWAAESKEILKLQVVGDGGLNGYSNKGGWYQGRKPGCV